VSGGAILTQSNRSMLARTFLPVLLGVMAVNCGLILDTQVYHELVFVNESGAEANVWDQTKRMEVARIPPNAHWSGRLRLGTHDGSLSDQVYVVRVDGQKPAVYTMLGETLLFCQTVKILQDSLRLESGDGKTWLVMNYSKGSRD
jgi:hypothetical protein